MNKIILGILAGAAATATATAAQATTLIAFNNPTGNLGTSETYSNGSLSVTAYGYSNNGAATDLWGKAGGDDEDGIGLAADPSGQHEIYYAGDNFATIPFIQLDVSGLGPLATSAQFLMGSTTNNELWGVFGSNTLGVLGTLLDSGTDEGTFHDLSGFGTFRYYGFASGGTVSNNQVSSGNVLLGQLSVTSVPEPGTWAMMLFGFGGIGVAMRRRKAASPIAQIA